KRRLLVFVALRGQRDRAANRRVSLRRVGLEARDAAASVRGGSRRDPDPDRADDSGAGYAAGSRGAMKIAVLFDTLHPEWDDADYKKAVEAKVEEAEYDVARALLTQGPDVPMVGVAEQLEPIPERLATFQPKLVFSGCG